MIVNGTSYTFDDGEEIPRVSQILSVEPKPWLEAWRARVGRVVADAIAQEAADIGTSVHTPIENYLTNGSDPLLVEAPEVWQGFTSWLDWWPMMEKHVQVITTELTLRSRLGFAGTTDALAIVSGRPCVLDWKTSKQLSPDYRVQVAAYGILSLENGAFDEQPSGLIVRCDKFGAPVELDIVSAEQMEAGAVRFLELLERYVAIHGARPAPGGLSSLGVEPERPNASQKPSHASPRVSLVPSRAEHKAARIHAALGHTVPLTPGSFRGRVLAHHPQPFEVPF